MTVGLTDFDTLLSTSPADAQERDSIPIKVVVVTMFEIGGDTGDRPGEFQTWVEQLPLPEKIRFPQGEVDPDRETTGAVF
jgi:purine nucleoside permease